MAWKPPFLSWPYAMPDNLSWIAWKLLIARSNSVLEVVSPRSKREPSAERRVVNVYERFFLLAMR